MRRSDGSGRGQWSNSSRGGHGAGRGGRGPRPGLQAAERRGKAGPGAGGAAPPRPAAGPLCRPGRVGAAAEAPPRGVDALVGLGAGRGSAAASGQAQQPGRTCRRGQRQTGARKLPALCFPARRGAAPKLSTFPLVLRSSDRSGKLFFSSASQGLLFCCCWFFVFCFLCVRQKLPYLVVVFFFLFPCDCPNRIFFSVRYLFRG